MLARCQVFNLIIEVAGSPFKPADLLSGCFGFLTVANVINKSICRPSSESEKRQYSFSFNTLYQTHLLLLNIYILNFDIIDLFFKI